MKLLITGFEPFGGENINPSWEAVKRLPERIGEWELIKLELPTVYGKAYEKAMDEAEKIHPDAIVSVGQAGGRDGITIEVVGINLREARIPDNEGNQPAAEPAAADGPAAFFATLPIRKMAQAVNDKGYKCSLSYSAGTFVCNDLLYLLLNKYNGQMPVGFIHVPFIREQVKGNEPFMELDDIVSALEISIAAI